MDSLTEFHCSSLTSTIQILPTFSTLSCPFKNGTQGGHVARRIGFMFHHYRDGRLHYTDGRVLVNASCRKLGHIDIDNSSSSIR